MTTNDPASPGPVRYRPIRHSAGTWINIGVHVLLAAFVGAQAVVAIDDGEAAWTVAFVVLAVALLSQVPMLARTRFEVRPDAIAWRSRWRHDEIAFTDIRRLDIDDPELAMPAGLRLQVTTRDDQQRAVPADAVSGLSARRNAALRAELVTAIRSHAQLMEVPVRIGGRS